jgi:hypothetical protein
MSRIACLSNSYKCLPQIPSRSGGTHSKKLIKNYTTEVPLQKTITEIHHLLAENGATGIATEYDKGRIRDIFFKIKVTGKELAFRLPAKPDKVYAALHGQTMSHYQNRYGKQWHDQAERVAWRICKSWLEAQITLITQSLQVDSF